MIQLIMIVGGLGYCLFIVVRALRKDSFWEAVKTIVKGFGIPLLVFIVLMVIIQIL